MGRILDEARTFLREEGIEFAEMEDRPVLGLAFSGDNGQWRAFLQERECQVLLYGIAPLLAPEHRRAAVAEFITRANYGMSIGNFEMDFADGEIRYKTSLDLGELPLHADLLRPVVYVNCVMLNRYLPGLAEVIAGADPEDAVLRVEQTGQG